MSIRPTGHDASCGSYILALWKICIDPEHPGFIYSAFIAVYRGIEMIQYLIMCPSLTAAQRSQKLLEHSGISTALVKAPQGLNTLGCGYALSLYKNFSEAVSMLSRNGMLRGKLFQREQNGDYTEVRV